MIAPNLRPGDILLGKYRVEHVLGQGGMGMVLAVRHMELDELFALKLIKPGAKMKADTIARFLREARAAAKLKGEHVARVHDVGRIDDDVPYMIMEHLEGRDLKAVLEVKGPLSIAEAVDYVSQTCDAVAEAHSAGIVHRDLKPANLFLTKRHDGTPCVKVLDFGISKMVVEKAPSDADLTETTALLGSPSYMSPEQMWQTKNTDHRGDIWALGVILFELLSGQLPFRGETVTELVSRVLQEPTPDLRQIRPEIPVALTRIVEKCLEKEREARFQSASELKEELRSFRQRESPTKVVVQAAYLDTTTDLSQEPQPNKKSLPAEPKEIENTTSDGLKLAGFYTTEGGVKTRWKGRTIVTVLGSLVALGGLTLVITKYRDTPAAGDSTATTASSPVPERSTSTTEESSLAASATASNTKAEPLPAPSASASPMTSVASAKITPPPGQIGATAPTAPPTKTGKSVTTAPTTTGTIRIRNFND